MTKKITLATFKSFIKKNRENLLVRVSSDFDGMQDCVVANRDAKFKPAVACGNENNTLGISGVWLVGSSRDYFTEFEVPGYKGFRVSNCCGSFAVAIKTNVIPFEGAK